MCGLFGSHSFAWLNLYELFHIFKSEKEKYESWSTSSIFISLSAAHQGRIDVKIYPPSLMSLLFSTLGSSERIDVQPVR